MIVLLILFLLLFIIGIVKSYTEKTKNASGYPTRIRRDYSTSVLNNQNINTGAPMPLFNYGISPLMYGLNMARRRRRNKYKRRN